MSLCGLIRKHSITVRALNIRIKCASRYQIPVFCQVRELLLIFIIISWRTWTEFRDWRVDIFRGVRTGKVNTFFSLVGTSLHKFLLLAFESQTRGLGGKILLLLINGLWFKTERHLSIWLVVSLTEGILFNYRRFAWASLETSRIIWLLYTWLSHRALPRIWILLIS